MKVAIIGTHGTGKTTLAYSVTGELKKKGYHATMLTEVARRCPFPINDKTSLKTEQWIMSRQISEEIEARERNKVVVCDRSVLDTYCYGFNSYGNNDFLDSIVKQWIPSYDVLFRTPIMKRYKLVNDGFRSTNKRFQRRMDQILEEQLKQREVEYIELPKKLSKEKFMIQIILKQLRNNNK